MAKRNYLVESSSGTGKSSVWEELQRRGYKAINGDRELAYKGNPDTGEKRDAPMGSPLGFDSHIWNVNKVKEIVANKEDDLAFFCGGSRNHYKFIDLFDKVFILDVDAEVLKKRLENREADDWGGNDEQKEIILRMHPTKKGVPTEGIVIDTTNLSIPEVVDTILEEAMAQINAFSLV